MRCVIFAGGPIESYGEIKVGPDDIIIAADGGARHAGMLGLTPHMIIGDMDSVSARLLGEFEDLGSLVERHPREKDEVDTELAVDYALSLDPDEIVIYGATGGRIDHELANIQLLVKPSQKCIRSIIQDHRQRVTLVTPELPAKITGRSGTFSLLPLTSTVTGVTTRGARWELRNAEFVLGRPYGVSNRPEAGEVIVSVTGGMLLLVEVFQE